MTENSTALLFDILDTATQGDPDSAANNIALLNQLLESTGNNTSNISANEIALLTEILSIITDQPPDVAANEIAVLTEILAAIQSQNPQVRANKIALLNEIAANGQSLVDALTSPVAASDLVAWYPFRQGDGSDATAGDSDFGDTTDYSATVNGASYKPSGGVTDIQTGANSGAFDFDGTDDFINLSGGGLDTTVGELDAITTMAWANTDGTSRNQLVFQTGSARWTIGFKPFGPSGWGFRGDDGINKPTIDSGDTTTNTFVHICAAWDGSQVEFYLDGVSQGTTPYSNIDDAGQISISSQNDGSQSFFDGIIDDVRVYNRALSDSQINQIYLNTEP